MLLEQIAYIVSEPNINQNSWFVPEECTRLITSINGYAFYQSSGDNSGHKGTWFPFLGVLEAENYESSTNKYYPKGWLKKPHYIGLPISLINKFSDERELLLRFATIPALLISSQLGGGFWESDKGNRLKNYLQKHYPEFYEHAPQFSFNESSVSYTVDELPEINNWLGEKAHGEPKQMQNDFTACEFLSGPIAKALNNRFLFQSYIEFDTESVANSQSDEDLSEDESLEEELSEDKDKSKLIKELESYIQRIDTQEDKGGTLSFKAGFRFFKDSQALNRQINYRLAIELRDQLKDPGSSIGETFQNIGGQRKKVAKENGLFKSNLYSNLTKIGKDFTGIHSEELNSIIKKASKM